MPAVRRLLRLATQSGLEIRATSETNVSARALARGGVIALAPGLQSRPGAVLS